MAPGGEGGADVSKLVVGALLILLLGAALTWLQGRFDDSDHRKAVEIVESYKPRGGARGLVDAMLERHPGVERDRISWSSEIVRSCLGHVRVYAYVPKGAASPAETYAFDVNLTAPSVHPTDDKTLALLVSLSTASTRAAAQTSTSSLPSR